MKIQGLQKMTLLDFPGRVACTVFLGGCDFRCPFCHNFDLVSGPAPAVMDDQDLLSFLKTRQGLLDGVAFTGGEPLLRNDLPDLIRQIRDLGFLIKVDTNGNHPELLKELVNGGLVEYIAMDIKNSPARYAATTGLETFDTGKVDESIRFLLEGHVDYEFRTTVVSQFHDRESFEEIGKWIEGADLYVLQQFVDRDTVPVRGLTACTDEEMKEFAEIVRPSVKKAEIRGL